MSGEGNQATGLANPTLQDAPPRRCVVAGCGCKDLRILSPRRARFHAYLARARGETADRVIDPDPEWWLPPINNEEA